MKQSIVLTCEFVKAIPIELEERRLYVSMDYATVSHMCCCGCGKQVVTPLSPTDWKLIYDGASISLSPSIGNWSFDCKSHYWIDKNTVRWADRWSKRQIATGRAHDRRTKQVRFTAAEESSSEKATLFTSRFKFWSRVWEWLQLRK
jgi:hypothetical protein